VFALVNGFVSIGLMAALALVTREPLVFPSLGPTAFLLFRTPRAASASPRNTILGHLIGVVAGYVALLAFGLTDAGPAFADGVSVARVGAVGLSLGLTAGFMVWLRSSHAPAGATTLIVSLGILSRLDQLAILMLGVLILVAQEHAIDHLRRHRLGDVVVR
jgi:CBS domain-containing membrane protein